jgi:N-acetylmuramoyl-L-alanine amidase
MKKIKLIVVLLLTLSLPACISAQNKKFKVVLDAGHGGKDPGAMHNGVNEKDIVLKTALLVGDILAEESSIEVLYTRKTDVAVDLNERAKIANKAHGNLFVSIHCNSAKKAPSAKGTETFVMGVTKNASNLDVARRENEVITLEKDYKVKYDGYDPKSPESVIGMSIMQETSLNQSIELAASIEKNFEKIDRNSRGVKQAGFLVLRDIYMPRVLVELGFLTNSEDLKFLNSAAGQKKLAQQIAKSIISYKKEYFGETSSVIVESKPTVAKSDSIKNQNSTTANSKTEDNSTKKGLEFRVQISASNKDLELKPQNFKGLNSISVEQNNNLYRYFYGTTPSYSTAKELLKEAKAKGYESSFLVAFKDGKKVSISEALK